TNFCPSFYRSRIDISQEFICNRNVVLDDLFKFLQVDIRFVYFNDQVQQLQGGTGKFFTLYDFRLAEEVALKVFKAHIERGLKLFIRFNLLREQLYSGKFRATCQFLYLVNRRRAEIYFNNVYEFHERVRPGFKKEVVKS